MLHMSLRITKTTSDACTIFKVDGRLAADGVADLERDCQSAEGTVYLDLTELLSADAQSIEAIKRMVDGGARLLGASPYIRIQLGLKEEE
jgi:hypothetical protein